MLECPNVLFLNCLGSYFYSIVKAVGDERAIRELLIYLSTARLSYECLDLKTVYANYKQNPWGYQPIRLKNNENSNLAINADFFTFLCDRFNIITQVADINCFNDLLNKLISNYSEGIFTICNIDEYYVSSSHKFFRKKHNKHFLLIDKLYLEQDSIQLIDSEKDKPIRLTCKELIMAITQSAYKKNLLYSVDCSKYQLNTKSRSISWDLLISMYPGRAIYELIQEISANKSKDLEMAYYFQGYYYTIMSKIIPYFLMLNILFQEFDQSLHTEVIELVRSLRNLINFMRFKIFKNQYDLNSILCKLQPIYDNCQLLYKKCEQQSTKEN